MELFTTLWTLKSTSIDKIHKIHAPKFQGVFFSEVAEAPQAAATRRTVLGDPETAKQCKILVDMFDKFQFFRLFKISKLKS